MSPDVRQIIFALERARDRLQAEADRLCDELDYNAEFFAEDADRMREAIALLGGALGQGPASPDAQNGIEAIPPKESNPLTPALGQRAGIEPASQKIIGEVGQQTLREAAG